MISSGFKPPKTFLWSKVKNLCPNYLWTLNIPPVKSVALILLADSYTFFLYFPKDTSQKVPFTF